MSTNPTSTKVWIVSLASAVQRRAQFAQNAPPDTLDWSYFDARSELPEEIAYDASAAMRDYGRALQPGELGCYASHVALWQWLVDSPYERMIVLEDDVVVDWEFLHSFMHLHRLNESLEYVRLFAKIPAPFRAVISPFMGNYHHLIRFTGYALGTQAYALTKAGARKFLARATPVLAPIDVYMDRCWEHGVTNLAIYPFPVYERYAPSSIGEERFSRKLSPFASHALPSLPRKILRKAHLWWSLYGFEPAGMNRLKRELRAHSIEAREVTP